MARFSEKVVLVTGASRGIGLSIAEAFLREGAKVALCARSLNALETIANHWNSKTRQALAIECDITSEKSVQAAIKRIEQSWGQLHCIVNNAGVSGRATLGTDSNELWNHVINVNLTGTYNVTKLALELMNTGSGRIINLSSVLGKFGVPGYAAYCTSKHGIIGLTRALALELAPRNVTVNAICPGWVDTDMAKKGIQETALALDIDENTFLEQAIESVPLRRFIQPEEIAQLALYLSSDQASAITGQAYNICGGQVMT